MNSNHSKLEIQTILKRKFSQLLGRF